MTQGALIFAFNNERIDYVSLARWSASRIRRHLDLPTCLITDRPIDSDAFDSVIYIDRSDSQSQRHFQDLDRPVTWYNQDRATAFDLSPWDTTLLLDADYVVASDQLKRLLQSPEPFLCYRWAYDVTAAQERLDGLNFFGQYRMPMHWATVIKFTKNTHCEMIFSCMTMIRNHWHHYRDLFALGRSPYRNDFALSISLSIVNGHVTRVPSIPWSMACTMPHHGLSMIDHDSFQITWTDAQQRSRRTSISDMDFHAMAKGQLGDIVANHT